MAEQIFHLANAVKVAIPLFFFLRREILPEVIEACERASSAREISDVLRVSSYNDLRSPVGRK